MPVKFEALTRARFEGPAYARQIHAAARRRLSVSEVTTAWRWLDSVGDGRGYTVDVYDTYAALGIYSRGLWPDRELLAQALLSLGVRGVYAKNRVRADLRRLPQEELSPAHPVCGEAAPAELVVREHDMRFAVRLDDGLSTGLFVDQRDNRARLRAQVAGGRVLNLFAYTCSFSVAAGLGGAREVISVDLSRRALQRGGRNLELNGLAMAQHRLLRADALQWLQRAVRRGEQFDWIVLDPPSFASRGRSAFSVHRDYLQAASQCLRLLTPPGRLLAVTNHRHTSRRQFTQLLREAARQAGREVQQLEQLAAPLDCPLGDQPDLATKSALLELAR